MNPVLQVPAHTRLPATLTAAEWACLFDVAQEVHPSITLQLRSQLQQTFLLEQARAQVPPQDPPQAKTVGSPPPVSADEARAYLDVAESNRRLGDGTLNLNAIGIETEDMEHDYAVSASLISLAMQHLDESIPNGQLVRSTCAFHALEFGTTQLRAWFERREAL